MAKKKGFPGEISINTLNTTHWGEDKFDEWGWRTDNDKRNKTWPFQKFERLNKKSLAFLGIEISSDFKGITLNTSRYVGVVPIYSPVTGVAVGDLVVKGRYGEDVSELITLLEGTFEVGYNEDLRLCKRPTIGAPIILECCKYIDLYLEAKHYHWQKFANVVKIQRIPAASTLWGDYAERSSRDPMQFDIYKNKCNILTSEHEEWWQLNYVLGLAIEEIDSFKVSSRTRMAYYSKIAKLRQDLISSRKQKTDTIRISMSDPCIIKELKTLAQRILNHESKSQIAWNFDYAEFFERYVQYIMEHVAKRTNYSFSANRKFGINGFSPSWSLKYIEPDIVLKRDKSLYIVDAKYKSHMLDVKLPKERSDDLKDSFRHDLHQVMAYANLYRDCDDIHTMLVYPRDSADTKVIKQVINGSGAKQIKIFLVGVPMVREKINDIVEKIQSKCFK